MVHRVGCGDAVYKKLYRGGVKVDSGNEEADLGTGVLPAVATAELGDFAEAPPPVGAARANDDDADDGEGEPALENGAEGAGLGAIGTGTGCGCGCGGGGGGRENRANKRLSHCCWMLRNSTVKSRSYR